MNELKDYLTEKNILTIFFPGLLATYPLWLLSLQAVMDNANQLLRIKDFITPLCVALSVLAFIGIYGFGYFVKRMAIRLLEYRIDAFTEKKIICCDDMDEKRKANPKYRESWVKRSFLFLLFTKSPDGDDSKFVTAWYSYLQKKFDKDNMPLLVTFYHDYLYSYHFQLTCILAIIIQAVSIWLLPIPIFTAIAKLTISGISLLLCIVLFQQSLSSAWEMHRLRCRIADWKDEKKPETDTSNTLEKTAALFHSIGDILTKVLSETNRTSSGSK